MKSVITCDLEGRIQTYGADAEAIFGWSADEVIGKRRVSMFSPGETVLEHVPAWLASAVKMGKHETDTVFLKKDGTQFPAHIRISPTFKDGTQIGYCGITTPLPESELERARPRVSLATKVFRWLVVTRAPFLTATVVPVLIGAALAPRFSAVSFVVTLIGALALHVAANTWNDYFDWKSGADQANNDYFLPFSGGSRAIELGLVTERGLSLIAWTSMLVAAACGAILAVISSVHVLTLGVIGAFAAYFYTAPPVRLVARRGLGELFVGACFGPLLVAGSWIAVGGGVYFGAEWDVFLIGVPIGLLTAAILWINEIPDAKSDALVGKSHLVVTLGARAARWGYVALILGAYGSLAALVANREITVWALAAFVALPLTMRAVVVLFEHVNDRKLVVANKLTIVQHLVFGAAMALAIWLG